MALANISTSTLTHLKHPYCNQIFTDKAELALNSDSICEDFEMTLKQLKDKS